MRAMSAWLMRAILLLMALAMAACGGGSGTGGTSGGGASPTTVSHMAYVANQGSDSLSAFSIDETTGQLTPVAGSPYATGHSPQAPITTPDGKFVYVMNDGDTSISGWSVKPGNEGMQAVAGSPFALAGCATPVSSAGGSKGTTNTNQFKLGLEGNWFSTAGSTNTFSYVITVTPAVGAPGPATPLTLTGSGTLTAPGYNNHNYTFVNIDASAFTGGGTITMQVTLGNGASSASYDLYAADFTPVSTGRPVDSLANAYDVTPGSVTTISYSFGAASTSTGSTSGSSTGTTVNNNQYKLGLEGNWFSPAGSTNTFSYVITVTPAASVPGPATPLTLTGSGTLTAPGYNNHDYTFVNIDASAFTGGGTITMRITLGNGASSASYDLYAADFTPVSTGRPMDSLANAYDVTPGSVTTISYTFGPTTQTGSNVLPGAAINNNGTYLYAVNTACHSISGFALDPKTGILTPLTDSPYNTDPGPVGIGFDTSGHYVFVTDPQANILDVYGFDMQTGSLTLLSALAPDNSTNQFKLGLEGNWGSPAGSTNTFSYTITITPAANEPGPTSPKTLTGSGTLVAPGSGNHGYTFVDIDASAFTGGGTITMQVTLGNGASYASYDLYAADFTPVSSGTPVDSLANAYDIAPGATVTMTYTFGPGGSQFVRQLPVGAVTDPSGHYSYVVNQSARTISPYADNASTGTVTPVAGGSVQVGAAPGHMTVH